MGKLPEQFAALEAKWGEWILDEEADRADLRLTKTTEQLAEFYEDLKPDVRGYLEYIDQHDIKDLPADVKNLWWLISSFVGVAAAIEMYGTIHKIPGVELLGKYRAIGMPNEQPLLR